MLSRQTSVVSSEVVDLSGDTDSDECVILESWNSQSTLSAKSTSLGALSLIGCSTASAGATSVVTQCATRQTSIGNGKGTSDRCAHAGDLSGLPILSLLSSLDEQSVEVPSYHPSAPSTVTASNRSTPRKRATASSVASDGEKEQSPPKKRKAATRKATTSTSTTNARAEVGASEPRQPVRPNAIQLKETGKKEKAVMKAINKRVIKKMDFIQDFTLCVSPAMMATPFIQVVASRLVGHGCNVVPLSSSDDPALFRWQRRVCTRYDELERQWIPVPQYSRFEATNMIYVHANDLVSRTNGIGLLEGRIERLKRNLELTPKHQIIVMIDDLEARYRKKGKGSRAANASARQAGYELIAKPKIERALAALQVSQKCLVVHVEGVKDAAEWIYNMTGDIGAKPHKLIEQSHLPFSPDMSIEIGRNNGDTYQKMLEQINLVTRARAEAVMTRCPTLRSLFEGYDNAPDANQRAEMLMDTIVDFNKNGSKSGRILNIGLSSKIAAVFWSYDSLMSIS